MAGGGTRVAGIIGWPVSSSLSPAIHNAAFAAAGLDWTYVAFPVPPGEIARAIAGMRAMGIAGLNVTMPHKHDVIAHLDSVAPDAGRAGAVNTIARNGERLAGSNTDGPGFLRFLAKDAGIDPARLDVLILGGGGAARGVCLALGAAGATVVVAARRPDQAAAAAALAGGSATTWDPAALAEAASTAKLVVNATPLGRDGEPIPGLPEALGTGHIVVDLVYRPIDTPLVRTARERGATAFNGLGMLLHQAALSFETWTGVAAPLDAMAAAIA